MVSSAANKHRISVSASVRDNSGGTAYAFALKKNGTTTDNGANDNGPSVTILKNKIKTQHLKPAEHMVQLGVFGSEFTSVSGDVDKCVVDFNNFSTGVLENLGEYFVYLYVVDIFNNMVIQPHPSNPVPMTSATIAIAPFDGYFISTNTSNIEYAEYRSNALDPVVQQKNGMDIFDFYNGRIDKLYANVDINPHESTVNNVRLVAFDSQADNQTIINNATTVVYNETTNNIFNETHDAGEIQLAGNIEFGKLYNVYSVIYDHGFNTDMVRQINTVTTGSKPILSGISVSIDEQV
tara:strand:- start:128 stop:1009 length:882 start_codon:yes stop_codon:yes gene_type:complete